MAELDINGVRVEDTFAEAFGMSYVRLILTAEDEYWLDAALAEFTGYSSSVIACDVEAGRECALSAQQTPDGRVGAAVMLFGFSRDALQKSVPNRVGQCVMTCPTTAVFDGLTDQDKTIALGKHIRFFGDGYQKSKQVQGDRYWRIPVMDGEFLVQDKLQVGSGVGGGNLIVQGVDQRTTLAAARRASEALRDLPGVITPFPGGVVRSGSKVGSRYKSLPASTADAYCPTLRNRVESKLADDAQAAYEIVIDGASHDAVGEGMQCALQAAVWDGIVAITAGNYGGKLGKHHYALHDLLASA